MKQLQASTSENILFRLYYNRPLVQHVREAPAKQPLWQVVATNSHAGPSYQTNGSSSTSGNYCSLTGDLITAVPGQGEYGTGPLGADHFPFLDT